MAQDWQASVISGVCQLVQSRKSLTITMKQHTNFELLGKQILDKSVTISMFKVHPLLKYIPSFH